MLGLWTLLSTIRAPATEYIVILYVAPEKRLVPTARAGVGPKIIGKLSD
jgi:hypothetical protein